MKMPKQEYAAEFKGLGLYERTQRNWVKAAGLPAVVRSNRAVEKDQSSLTPLIMIPPGMHLD